MKTGIANLPLHGGSAPAWLFNRMVKLAREIVIIIVEDSGPSEVLRKLSNPFWFQALGCVLGFDWHSSGVTTTVCGAIKEGIKGIEKELGVFAGGGKGNASRNTPKDIEKYCDIIGIDSASLVYASRMSAKVDSAAVQDGYQLYHHCFFFTKDGNWSVVQQGMNGDTRYARRYHWLSEKFDDFTNEPHAAICCESRDKGLNMVADESKKARETSVLLATEEPGFWENEIRKIQCLDLPSRHAIRKEDIKTSHFSKILIKTYETKPKDYSGLLEIEGVGPKTVRSLSLLSELIYGVKSSFKDPARFSFAHGGKDGYPYPVDSETYDRVIEVLNGWINRSKTERTEKLKAFERLNRFAVSVKR
ncbi:MAG: hypothetical protein A2W05_01660 [Candidatus Schekmanbacteria bacterium RBG_16_38_10]|uniref:DUF763 domain-containing protein n=1 Tax=Candidatus Schekmanbacteria bacterium RBG_16_38_10 TaxID=1817879 RepID=A0A1F7RW48_9BACT|nr:MAG: hypothetical protein A2W05_01660 [Candidatus Schekmanbacteria bacterium RBG_16_38_10]